MEFRVLGPLCVIDRGADLAPTAPKQRQLLALLILNANRIVSMAQLVEELWEYNPPSSAVAAVHTYVMQLRRSLLGEADGGAAAEQRSSRLVTRDHGYLFRVRPGELDLDVFEDRVRAARDALAGKELAEGVEQLRAAEAMWTGPLLVDVTAGPLLRSAAEAIERNRLDAVVQRLGADLHLGGHHELLGELSGLVLQHPADEALTSLLMLALYRSGRQADALTAHRRLRRVLRDELDTTPSQRMEQLHADVLAAHPRLEPPSAARGGLALDLFTSAPADRVARPVGRACLLLRT
ncbi:AfsR/SARP family transcriptional regulator [Streptacidiphilus anmyonensis]|uniref:AfsR/SARP family transcriptional regulator n=1 Tax=Streptacidiphilus anmyonensis TaxID=405782 RepID=UPI0005A748B1|nr:AfsR/SARP family transcriptional regulator [Streptacidiphilus anmyonensis]